MTWIYILAGIVAYSLLGCFMLALIDNQDDLGKWFHRSPGTFLLTAFPLWPALVFLFWKNRKKTP